MKYEQIEDTGEAASWVSFEDGFGTRRGRERRKGEESTSTDASMDFRFSSEADLHPVSSV